MSVVVLVGATVLAIVMGVPVAFAMGIGSVLAILVTPGLNLQVVVTSLYSGIDSFVLLAVPLFVLVGEIMREAGLSERLADLSRQLVGHLRGGLGHVAIVGTMFFSGMIGSKVAETYTMGSVMFPIMKREKYPIGYAAALISAASAMGELIPPAILMVVLGVLLNTSVAKLFIAGFVPAFIMALLLAILVYRDAARLGVRTEGRLELKAIISALRKALSTLVLPVVIFGGILFGIATPTEVSGLAAAYAFILGVTLRGLGRRNLWRVLARTVGTSSSILLLIGMASVFSFVLSFDRVPQALATAFLQVAHSPLVFLAISNVIFIAAGAFLEGLPGVTIIVPVLLPIAQDLHVNLLHYAILITASVGIGLYLPPLGIGAITAAQAAGIKMSAQMRYALGFNLFLLVGLSIFTLFPQIVLWLPNLVIHH